MSSNDTTATTRRDIMSAKAIALLLYANDLHLPGPTQHEFWAHVAQRLSLKSSVADVEDAILHNRRYSKPIARSTASTSTQIDKKLTEHRYRLVDVHRREIETLRRRLADPAATAAAVDAARDRIQKLEAEVHSLSKQNQIDEKRLIQNSKTAQATRTQKRKQRSAAGSTGFAINQKNKKKFKVHENHNNQPYPPTVQNVVSKAKIPFRVVVAVIRWMVKGKYIEQRFPAPSVNMHMPRASITHYASGEIGCVGARSEAASIFAVNEYACIIALQHNEEMQVINFGIVNLTASAGYHHMTDLKQYHGVFGHLEHLTSTYDRTVIDIHRGKEKIPAAANKKGVAINTCPTGRVCYVGLGSPQEFELARETLFLVAQDIAASCAIQDDGDDDDDDTTKEERRAKRQKVSATATVEEIVGDDDDDVNKDDEEEAEKEEENESDEEKEQRRAKRQKV